MVITGDFISYSMNQIAEDMTAGLQRITAPDGVERTSDGDIVDVMASGLTQRPILPPAGHPAIDEFFVTGPAVIRAESKPFRHAGTESLEQSIGVIMGANIGTTITGWLVAILGFKIKITAMAMPSIALGFFARFVSSRRVRDWGEVLLGFGLLFLGLLMTPRLREPLRISQFLSKLPLGRLWTEIAHSFDVVLLDGTDPVGGRVIAELDDTLCRFLTAGDVDGDGDNDDMDGDGVLDSPFMLDDSQSPLAHADADADEEVTSVLLGMVEEGERSSAVHLPH